MKKLSGLLVLVCLGFGGAGLVAAQERADGSMSPPKVLVIMREFLKPGKGGSAHDRSESAFVSAMTNAKWPTHYIGMDSLSGPSRSLFLVGYDSFAAWEKDSLSTQKNATLAAALDRAAAADGELLSRYETGVFVFNEEESLRTSMNIGEMRYMEITSFKVREGHRKEWTELVKIYKSGHERAVPEARWAVFEGMYGTETSFLVITPMKSTGEVDQEMTAEETFYKSLSANDAKKMSELTAACIESTQSNLFMFNPKMSYPAEMWVKADPAFWRPRTTMMKKQESKPTP
jgi:hypothetical protein